MPTISPARTSRLASTTLPSSVLRPCTDSRAGPGSIARLLNRSVISRPTIIWTRRRSGVSGSGTVPIRRPSRSTVTREAQRYSSRNRWEMNTTATPRRRSCSIRSSRRSVAASDSELVASSRISTLDCADTARATSISCCSSIERSPTRHRVSISTPSSSSAWRARRWALRQSIAPARRGSRPMSTFSVTDSVGARVSSWLMATIPCWIACPGVEKLTGLPSTETVPASGRRAP